MPKNEMPKMPIYPVFNGEVKKMPKMSVTTQVDRLKVEGF
jgi:hypothetical protein